MVQKRAKEVIMETEVSGGVLKIMVWSPLQNNGYKGSWLLSIDTLGQGEVNTEEGRELLKLKNKVGMRTNGYKMAMNKFQLEIKR